MARRTLKNLIEDFVRFRLGNPPSDRQGTPLVDPKDEVVNRLDASTINSASQLQEFRTLAEDRNTQYNTYDEMKTDSVIAAALELYADDSTQYDEQGRVVWIESEDETIVEAGTRLLDIFEIPERAWKHIYQACLYGDYYLKLHRYDEMKRSELEGGAQDIDEKVGTVRIVNDEKRTKETNQPNTYVEYVEDVADPATVFELRKFGKTAGFVEVSKEDYQKNLAVISNATIKFQMKDISVYQPDRFVHIMLGENMSRDPEEITIDLGDGKEVIYSSARGKSILQDVYPIQRELQLLEDSLLLNRLTRSSLIRILEVEVGSMPKTEVNAYLRRIKNLIEQHIAMDKDDGSYKSFNAPGPIDNVIYVPTRNGKGSISVNNLGGDVNVRDIADIDYFSNKRAGALKIPRSYLGDDMDGCLRGETKLLLLNGQHRTIKYLYDNREEYLGKGIMSCNADGTLIPTTITDIKLTRKNATFVRVHLDNGEYFDVTEDHLCMMRDGTFNWADDLRPGDSLMPMYDKIESGRRYVWDNHEESWKAQYRLVALHKYGELLKGHQIHHIDEIKINDDFDNLEQLTISEHYAKHSEMLHKRANQVIKKKSEDPEWCKRRSERISKQFKGVPKSDEHRKKISEALKGKPSNHPFEKGDKNPVHFITEETRRKISEANTGRKHSEETKRKIGDAHRGKVVSDETRRKLSESHPDFSGEKNPMYGKSVEFTDERRREYSEKFSGKGNPCYGKKLCNNGVVNKYISLVVLEEFLKENPEWKLGSLKKDKAPYNHKVVKVERLDVVEDAYDIEVENESHTFILDAGVFVHNSGLSNGGSLTRLDIRYARTIKRIQTAYIRAITNLLNLFFIDKNLDYVNKFQVRMTSPSTQEDLERQELIAGNIDLSSSILDLTGSLEGDTQKEVLKYLIDNLLKMPEISEIIEKDKTPEEEVDIDGGSGGPNIDVDADFGGPEDTGGEETVDMSDEFNEFDSGDNEVEGGFTDAEFSEFEDEI